MNVLAMIDEIQAKAKAANGVLTDLALPQTLYDAFMDQIHKLSPALYETKIRTEQGVIYYNGTKIHTGDDD